MKAKTGWFGQSVRHSNARKYGRAIPKIINLKRYAGTWTQTKIRNEPSFQKGCSQVKAKYTLTKDGKVKVVNKCYDQKGKLKNKIEGTVRSVSKNNKKLKVKFFPFIEGDYNIVKLNPSYTKAVVKGNKTTWTLQKLK